MVYCDLYKTSEHMDSDPFIVTDDCTYVNVRLQKMIVKKKNTILHKKKQFLTRNAYS